MPLHRCVLIILALILCGCVGSTIPPVPYEPASGGNTVRVHFEICRNSDGSGADARTRGLFSFPGRIYSITLHLYQYEGCRKVERGTVVLKPSHAVDKITLKANALLFVDARFNGSKGWARSDLVFHLEEKNAYTVSTTYDDQPPRRFGVTAYRNLLQNGAPARQPVEFLTYRQGLLSAMMNCRDQEKR